MPDDRMLCENCGKELVEESERKERLHKRCKPNPEELRKLEEIERLIRVYHFESSNDDLKDVQLGNAFDLNKRYYYY